MFHILGMGLYCLLGACPVFVADTAGREISSPYIGKPGILHQFSVAYPVSTSVLCNNYFRFHSVPFRSWVFRVFQHPEKERWTSVPILCQSHFKTRCLIRILLYDTIQVKSISVPTRVYMAVPIYGICTVTVYLAKPRNLNCNWQWMRLCN